jgi:CRISPR system Cascade subunit CasE
MYLSRVEINKNLRSTMKLLASPQVFHAAIEAGFPSKPKDAPRNLWRLDALDNSLFILTLSAQKPDFTHIIEQFGWPASNQGWETKDYEPFLTAVAEGQRWRFRLRANPVHSVKDAAQSDKARGKVLAHVTVEQQRQWLLNRAHKHGFALEPASFDIVDRTVRVFKRQESKVTLSVVTFEGMLAVEDAAAFTQALTQGIGRAKAYGCGLMTLARLK